MAERTVWRFTVDPSPEPQYVPTYGRPKVLAIGPSREGLSIWIEHAPDEDPSHADFAVIGTGWKIPDGYRHIGTYTTPAAHVWHLYAPEAPSG